MMNLNWLGQRNIRRLLACAALSGLSTVAVFAQSPAFHRDSTAGDFSSKPGWMRPAAPGKAEAANEPAAVASELVRERYENGTTRLEREVVLSEAGDFVNHGKYREFSPSGRVVRQGEFNQDKMEGVWQWAFKADDAPLFAGQHEANFQGPFLSQATFRDDKLHGSWTITDRFGHKAIEWNFEDGVRAGRSTWSYPNGHIRRQVEYRDDVEEGKLTEWSPNGQVTRTETVGGGRLRQQVTWQAPGQKSAEGPRYVARQEVAVTYDWWNGIVSIEPVGEPIQDAMHGVWTFWHPNGQMQMRGEYDRDQPVGKFAWWHANGVKQAEGEYNQGWRIANWTSWHANGRRASRGQYADDVAVGSWTHWADDGSLESVEDLGLGESHLVDSSHSNGDEAGDLALEPPEPARLSPRVTNQLPSDEQRPAGDAATIDARNWNGAEAPQSLPKFGTARRPGR